MHIDLGQLLAALIAAASLPSAITGLLIWRLKRSITAKEEAQAEQTKAQEQLMVLVVQSSSAAIALGEATARAVQRIPDAHCNGDMHAALAYATDIKHRQREFLTRQGIHSLAD